MNSLEIAGDIVSAGTALAGLILVYLGAVAAGYVAYLPHERKAVRAVTSAKAWRSFIGIVLALGAALFGIVAKGIRNEAVADFSALLLFLALAGGIWIAYQTASEVT